ncbi:hypothetical protein J6590_108456 [Homalodisca vitripennis]|nr:hypothetical protein J6590_108456 [Homalodisca vitripennis]
MKETRPKKKKDELLALSRDLQKALPFPKLTVSDAYYRRNMYCYNLGVHDLANNNAAMYVWDECTASRGSQEIASAILKHLSLHVSNQNHIIIYSDTCIGQNRNIKVALALMKFVQDSPSVNIVEQKFLVSGHSYLPNDSDFGLIEQCAKMKSIYIPDDWYSGMASARKKI